LKNSSGISVRVLGDYGPFSRIGKSIGYQVTIGESCYLIDCGSPVFQKFGGHGLKAIKGLIITHCHDDHKRWFSDFALFNRYAPDVEHRLPLMTSESVNQGLETGSSSALSMSLDIDCMRVIDIAYEEYIDFTCIAPKPKYRIEQKLEKDGISRLVVVDQKGAQLPPDQAKIFIGTSGVPRLLFRDPPSGEWVEPESFYPFSSTVFYEEKVPFRDSEGFAIEAINAPVWHGVPSIGVKFSTGDETLIFSADTNHDLELWTEMYSRKIPRKPRISNAEFEGSAVIFGDINDYIERIWSEERYRDAVAAFRDAVVIHDISLRKSVVHTDYRRLNHTTLERSRTILTHSPDKMTSEWLLSEAEKKFRINGSGFSEVVNGKDVPVIGDYFHKEDGRYYVCFKNDNGRHSIYERDFVLTLSNDPFRGEGSFLSNIDIYEDINGQYFPMIEDGTSHYSCRPDGRVELLEYDDNGSRGRIVEDARPRLTREFLSRN
jgi:ribonuclease BN (tRNA processing enzyme)